MNNCTNCNAEVSGKFCHDCGFPIEARRIDRQYIIDEISGVLNFDKGIFYTIRELFFRPGLTTRRFIRGDRKRIVKPIIFLIICSLVYTIAQQYLGFEASVVNYDIHDEANTPVTVKIFEWFSTNYGYANIFLAIFIAFWIKILFRKHPYNYYEVFILLCFIIGNSILINAFLGIIESVIGLKVLELGALVGIIYTTWSIGRFFDQKKKRNYLKGFLSYLLGVLTCFFLFFSIGLGIDTLLK